jgi:hypothetical protein
MLFLGAEGASCGGSFSIQESSGRVLGVLGVFGVFGVGESLGVEESFGVGESRESGESIYIGIYM